MSDEKLESFKIGDSFRDGMSKPPEKAAADAPQQAESYTLGFSRIENLLENEDPAIAGENLSKLLSNLEKLHESSTTNREKASSQKAIAAVERCVDLLDYLFQTKAELESNPG